jgi:uncharacterized protein (TIGR02246 family)
MHLVRNAANLIAALALLVAAVPAAADGKAAESAIRAGNAAWLKAYNAGDADAIAKLYEKDGVLMAPGFPAAHGQAAIKETLVKDIAGAQKAGVTLTFGKDSKIVVSGKLAVDFGTWSVSVKSGAVVDSGSYLDVWRDTGGKWLLIRDMWNSDRPPAPPPAEAKK